jgi:NADH-quinone oxidoreductase subunit N
MTTTVKLLTPEIVLVTAAVSIYVAGAFFSLRRLWAWIALGAVIIAVAALASSPGVIATGPSGINTPIDAVDPLAFYVRWLALGIGALFVLLASRPLDTPGTPEYIGSLLLTIAGVMLVAASQELVILFLGLELVSIPTYVLLYLGRRDEQSQEAAAKYFFLSILASAILLYGFSLLYGATGTTELDTIHDRLLDAPSGEAPVWLARIALVLILAGLGFKIAAVPFHFYAPDVFQGTTHPNAALLSVVPKLAGFVALVRLGGVAMEAVDGYAWHVAVILAIATMTVGNVLALWQANLRRLLAYSSIAHAGYMLIGFAVYTASPSSAWDGVSALMLYLLVYAVATIGVFAALSALGRGAGQIETVDELAGLAWTGGRVRPVLAWSIALFMFSLAGIPPLAGFWGKLAVFAGALGVGSPSMRPWFTALVVIGVLNAAVAAAYYLRVVGTMFFRIPLGTPWIQDRAGGAVATAVVCALLAVAIGLSPGFWIHEADSASLSGGAAASGAGRNVDHPKGRSPSQPAPVLGGDRFCPFRVSLVLSDWEVTARCHRPAN